jgi:hypothetical protein
MWRRLALLAAILAGAAALAWTALGRWELPEVGPRQQDYYNLLAEGLRKGSLALDIEVPEALRHVEDLRDTKSRPPDVDVPHDVSFYRGRYFLYFGVVPTAVLFLPFRLLTGHDLPLALGSLIFGIGAFLLTAWLWLALVRDHFPRVGLPTRIAGVLALGLAGGQWVLERRISIWEPSIIAGHFFLVSMLAAGYRALRSRNPYGWLAASGAALGLAIGSRPNLAAAGLGMVCLVLAIGLRDGARGSRLPAKPTGKATLAAGVPLTVVVAGLLAYNWARFGNPFEFGLNYQMASSSNSRHFSLSYIPFNAFTYFFSAPQWGRYFPFLHPIARRPQPPGYYGYEFVYGALVVCPVVWFAVLIPGYVRRMGGQLRPFVAAVASVALGTTLVLLCFDTATARYETDFLPWWVWLGALGYAFLEDGCESRGGSGASWAVRAAFGVCAAFSCLMAFCVGAELHGVLEFDNPAAYRKISRFLNAPTALAERLAGYVGGAVTMQTTFAERPTGSYEPLLVTGVEYQKDYVYLFYQSAQVVRFCYSDPGETLASSADIAVEAGRPYAVRIECPSLYPPEGHPAFDGWEAPEVDSLKRWVRIVIDGRTVLLARRRGNDASPDTLQIGRDRGGLNGLAFAGRITDVRRVGWSRPEGDLRPAGDFGLAVEVPDVPPENNQPLLSAGTPGRADLVGLRMSDAEHYALVYESWGDGLWRSGPLPMPSDRRIALRARLGGTLGIDEASPLGILARSVVFWRDGTPIWWHRSGYPLGADRRLSVASNTIGSSAMAPDFQGRLVSVRRLPISMEWHPGPFSALSMELGGRGDGAEPLITTGRRGRADMLAIEWMPGGDARFLYDHWGAGIVRSATFTWPESSVHRLRLEMPSLASLGGQHEGAEGEGRLEASADGTSVWEARVPYYGAPSDSISVGKNDSGFLTAGVELRSTAIELHQEPLISAGDQTSGAVDRR